MIENTTTDTNRLLFLANALGIAGAAGAIEAQEKRGQQQLVNSDRLPTDLRGGQDQFEALGFTFGEPDPGDPLFRPATLPAGWRREASDHDMWSYIVDEHGRQRVGVFYKAAFYDRKAHATVTSVRAYIRNCQYDGTEIVPDSTWANPAAIVEAAKAEIADAEESIELWSRPDPSRTPERAEYAEQRIREDSARRDSFAAIAAAFDQPNAQ